MALIIQVYSYCISIIDSKTLSITIIIRLSIGFSDTVTRLYTNRESLCTGTYFIAIYCRHSLDFIIGYFKAFSNAIFNFDFYGISIGFGGNNSKTSISFIVWLILMILLLQILKHFLLLLQLLILRLLMMVVLIALKTVLLNFRSGVKVCVRGPPYTTAPPCNAWGNAPVDDS